MPGNFNCWCVGAKGKNRPGFTFYLTQTLCSPRPVLYSRTLKLGGFSAKLREFHNAGGTLEGSLVLPTKLLPKVEKCQMVEFLIFSQDAKDTLEE